MSDEKLCQPALLVMPGDRAGEVRSFWEQAVKHKGERREVDPDRSQDLIDLAEGLKMYPQFGRAVHYLRGLAGAEHRPRYAAKPLEFIALGGGNSSSFIVGRPGPRPVPAMPHKLNVRFHR